MGPDEHAHKIKPITTMLTVFFNFQLKVRAVIKTKHPFIQDNLCPAKLWLKITINKPMLISQPASKSSGHVTIRQHNSRG